MTTIETINNGETLLSVRTKMNNNFSALNVGKQEAMGANDNYVTDAEKINIGNLNSSAYQPTSAFDASGSATTAETNAKAYADSLVVGLWDDRGNFDASVNAYPSTGGSGTAGAILKGDTWTISVTGTLPTAQVVEIGDIVRSLIDTPGNTQANWAIQQNNIGYTAENSVNKKITMTGNEASDIFFLSAKAIYTWATGLFTLIGGSISQSFSALSIELGHASDTSITRVSAGVIAVEGVIIPTETSTNTLTNKRVTKRILSAISYTTDTGTSLNCDTLDSFIVTAQAGALKLNNPTGTPTDGQLLMVAITGTAARVLTYDTQFEASTVALPTTTVTTARLNMLFCWRADTSKWVIIAAV